MTAMMLLVRIVLLASNSLKESLDHCEEIFHPFFMREVSTVLDYFKLGGGNGLREAPNIPQGDEAIGVSSNEQHCNNIILKL